MPAGEENPFASRTFDLPRYDAHSSITISFVPLSFVQQGCLRIMNLSGLRMLNGSRQRVNISYRSTNGSLPSSMSVATPSSSLTVL